MTNKVPTEALFHRALVYAHARNLTDNTKSYLELPGAEPESALDAFIDQLEVEGIPYADRADAARIALSVASGLGISPPVPQLYTVAREYNLLVARLQTDFDRYGFQGITVLTFLERKSTFTLSDLGTLLYITIEVEQESLPIISRTSFPTQEIASRAYGEYDIIAKIIDKLSKDISLKTANAFRKRS